MRRSRRAARGVIRESSPVTFVRRLREMPVLRRLFAIIDRFL
ncbi:MAG TPA: hypothetical protein VK969_02880 [Acidimicrobiia bacterium]|nr:hypothetical protein [Acidimicrobiia bacterium]